MQAKKVFKMGNHIRRTGIMLLASFAIPAAVFWQSAQAAEADEVHLTFIHLNDIYEVTPVSGGTQGGMARVATLKKELLAENPNTFITLSGDIYGPSGLSNAAIVDGEELGGKHVVSVLNMVGIDYFTFGDHEFDQFSGEQVLQRFKETTFPMISSNYADVEGKPFQQSDASGATIDISKNAIFTATNAAGATVRVGIFGVSEPFSSRDDDVLEVTYTEWEDAAREQVAELTGGANPVDLLIALTHFDRSIDKEIATTFPEIDLILGGDDHEYMKIEMDAGLATIYKSDSNARNNYIVELYYDTASGELRIEDRVQAITDEITDDPDVLAEIDKWVDIGFDALREEGMEPERVIGLAPFDLDGFATSMRNRQTELTLLILRGVNNVVKTDLSMFIAGMFRLDDKLPAGGEVTEYDSVRAFPTDYRVASVQMLGSVLESHLEKGYKAQGTGSFYLLTDNVTRDENGTWLISDKSIVPERTYSVGLTTGMSGYLTSRTSEEEVFVAFEDGEFVKTTNTTLRQVMIDQIAKGCAATYYPETGQLEVPCIHVNGDAEAPLFKLLIVPQTAGNYEQLNATRIKQVGADEAEK